MRRATGEVIGDAPLDLLAIGFVYALEPLVRIHTDFGVVETEHRLPAGRQIDRSVAQVPVPQAIVGTACRERVAFFAGPQGLLRAQVRDMGPDAGQRDRE